MAPSFRLALTLALTAAGVRAADPTPGAFPAERYSVMAGKSPFALATAAAPLILSQASFAANWFVSGIGRIGEDYYVAIKARDATLQFSLFGREPHAEYGVAISSVNWSETVGKGSVVLQKGTEMAKLEFNEADLRSPAVGASSAAANSKTPPVNPATPPVPGAVGMMNASPPVVTPAGAVQQVPASANPAGEIRRRVRVISVPK